MKHAPNKQQLVIMLSWASCTNRLAILVSSPQFVRFSRHFSEISKVRRLSSPTVQQTWSKNVLKLMLPKEYKQRSSRFLFTTTTTTQDSGALGTDSVKNSPNFRVTERCLKRIEQVLDSTELIRIGVRGGGCSGFEYEITIEKRDTINKDEDILFDDRVVIDKESFNYIKGAKLDYEDELIRAGFRVVDNPLAEKGCSCGASFSLKF